MYKIGITGGIGSGKSVVSGILRRMGYEVYDSDTEAKRLMCSDKDIVTALTLRFGKEIYRQEGSIDRIRLAEMIFRDKENLKFVNSTVHPVVCRDFERWAAGKELAFIESAILFEAKLDGYVNRIIFVDAPIELRISRVIRRDRTTEEKVRERISNQQASMSYAMKRSDYVVNNDGTVDLEPQIVMIIEEIRKQLGENCANRAE